MKIIAIVSSKQLTKRKTRGSFAIYPTLQTRKLGNGDSLSCLGSRAKRLMLTLRDVLGKTDSSTSFALKFDMMMNQPIATNTGGKYATCLH